MFGNVLRLIRVSAIAGVPSRGLLLARGLAIPCALGRSGISARKQEGDGATPAGRHRLVSVLYRPDRVRRPQTALPVALIQPDSGWCDDPADRNYNRPVRRPYPASHERLWRDDHLYDLVIVLDYNLTEPRPGVGSAIFLHVAAPSLAPTAGCVAVTEISLRRLLARVGPETELIVA